MSGLTDLMPRGDAERTAEGIAALIDGLLHPPRAEGRHSQCRKCCRARRRLPRHQTCSSRPDDRSPQYPHRHGRPAERNAVSGRAGGVSARAAPEGAGERSARFPNNYTASPLCAPGRASFMPAASCRRAPASTTMRPNSPRISRPIAHHLRAAGYYTCLSGKMHFVGPDQMHGFEERLTTDIYPADFGWTPDYRKPGERIDWWYHNLGSVTGAGVAEITNQMEYDDEVAFLAEQKLYQLARESDGGDRRPWCLTVSFTHPHDPYVARRKYWDLYEDCPALEPASRRSFPTRSRIRIRSGSTRPATTRALTSRPSRCGARGAAISPASPISTTRWASYHRRAGTHPHARRHARPVLLRPRRHAGRARPVVQDVLLRRRRTGAADDRRPRHQGGCDQNAGFQSRHTADALRASRHRAWRDRAMDRRSVAAAAGRGRSAHRPGADGICGGGLLRADGGDPRGPPQVRALRDRPAATL